MDVIKFSELPDEFTKQKAKIENKALNNLYSKIDFLYFPYSTIKASKKNDTNSNIEIGEFLINFLDNIKLLIFHLLNLDSDQLPQLINVVVCIEKKCVFIDLIDSIFIQKIITNLKEKSEIIETNFDLYQEDNFQKNNIKEEIDNFFLILFLKLKLIISLKIQFIH